MKLLVHVLILLFGLGLSLQSQGQSLSSKAPNTQPRFKANFDSLYYDLQGRHDADSGVYGFEGVTFSQQTFQLTYLQSPTLHFSVQGRQIRNYAETKFFGVLYKDTTQGIGDTKLKATKTFFNGFDLIIADLGLNIPTGSISEKNVSIPAFNYPYNMQLGSGTYDLEPTLMYLAHRGKSQFGAMGMAILRTGRNSFSYRRGNEYLSQIWYSWIADPLLSPGLYLNFRHVQRMNGQDSTYGRLDVLRFYHSPRNFWELTPNIRSQIPVTKNLKLNVLAGRPLWQESNNIENIQVYARWFAQIGAEGTF